MVGVPPLPGLQSKFVLFGSAVEAGLAGERWLILLAVAGVLNSALEALLSAARAVIAPP